MIKCVRCGSEHSEVFHEIQSNEYLCNKCMWSKKYREEKLNENISEVTENMLKEYSEWRKGIQ